MSFWRVTACWHDGRVFLVCLGDSRREAILNVDEGTADLTDAELDNLRWLCLDRFVDQVHRWRPIANVPLQRTRRRRTNRASKATAAAA